MGEPVSVRRDGARAAARLFVSAGVSVAAVIVSYHTGGVLWDCLDAVAGEVDCIVVVDNGNPAEVVARLERDARVSLVRAPGNVGFAWGCRLGADMVEAEHLFFLNPDAVVKPGCTARLVEVIAEKAVPAIVGARLVDENRTELRGSRRRVPTPWTLLRGLNLHREPLPASPIRVGAVSGAAMLMRRADWEALGGFDAGYFLHVEDLEICRRANNCWFVPDAEVVHPGASSDVAGWVVETHKAMGWKRYWVSHYPWLGRLVWPAMSLALRRRRRPLE